MGRADLALDKGKGALHGLFPFRLISHALRDRQTRGQLLHAVRNRLWSDNEAVLLRRDLHVPHTAPEATIPITVRQATAGDRALMLDPDADSLSDEERWLRRARARLLDAGFGTCYVAATATGVPCYMQFLFGPDDNERIRRYFAGAFPWLKADEALLESAFTPEAFRGRKIMPAAMARIAAHAAALGARYVVTVVGPDNIASLKGCAGAGFAPSGRLLQRWRALHCFTEVRSADDLDRA